MTNVKKFFTQYHEVIITLLLCVVMLVPALVSAGGAGDMGTPSPSGSNTFTNPLKVNSVCGLVVGVLNAVMIIGIPIAVLFIVWAGLKFILAQGKPEAIKDARNNFLHVLIGIALFVGSSLIAKVILNTLRGLGVEGVSSC